MIIDFTTENFRSIKEEQTFSMSASDAKDEHPDNLFQSEKEKNIYLLKAGVIFGANASGKSNLLLAIKTFRDFVVNSTDLKVEQEIPYYDPYRLDEACLAKPTAFELEFIGNDKTRYKYTVLFDKNEILMEQLLFYPSKQEARLFLREQGKSIKFGSQFKGKKKSIESELLPNNLFLSKAANSNHEQLKGIYLYFKNNLIFHLKTDAGKNLSSFTTAQLRKKDSEAFRRKLINFLVAADTGIHSIGLEINYDALGEKNQYPDRVAERSESPVDSESFYRPVVYHRVNNGSKEGGTTSFRLDEESDGTIKMYAFAGKIISALERGFTIIADELDNSLHPLISEYILNLFSVPETNPGNAQLIAATHDTTLLNPEILRRDQIWFVQKNTLGATTLFSLDEFNKNEVRKNTPFGKWYLDGRFGAIPLIAEKMCGTGKDEEQR
jgi:AAA15 family ATPase/GTPase